MVKSNREIGDAYEHDVISRLGGKAIKGSGSTPFKKEDVDFPGMRAQMKFASGNSLSIKGKDLVALEENALNCGKTPALFMRIDGVNQEWVAFPLWKARQLLWFLELIRDNA